MYQEVIGGREGGERGRLQESTRKKSKEEEKRKERGAPGRNWRKVRRTKREKGLT